jgi:hypothetical protein
LRRVATSPAKTPQHDLTSFCPRSYESYRKSDLELAIDEHLSEHASRYQLDPRFQDYFKSRARAGGSPVKKESLVAGPDLKPVRRRATKVAEEITAAE